MELVIIGAAGRTGRLIVDQALAEGHYVTAYVRRPEAVTAHHDRLTVVRGDVLDPSGVADVIAGKDAVVSVLGVKSRTTTTLFSAGITNVVRAMEAKGVRRVVATSTDGLDTRPRVALVRRLAAEYIVERVMRNVFLDLARMEDELEVSDTDWTVIRATPLKDDPPSGPCRVALDGRLDSPRSVSRADLANYVVSCLGDPATYGKKVLISG
jgi:putative NADH-flavin reductase